MAINRMGPPCPECGSLVTDVNRTTRSAEGHFWRRRDCPSCGAHFQTIQHAEIVAPTGAVTWKYRKVHIQWHKCRERFAALLRPPANV
mgnify:FL=1